MEIVKNIHYFQEIITLVDKHIEKKKLQEALQYLSQKIPEISKKCKNRHSKRYIKKSLILPFNLTRHVASLFIF